MILSLWESGCRAAEFLNLKIKDLHFEGNTVSFTVDGKTGQRQCFLVASVPSLIQWLEVHPQKNDSNAWLWAKQTHKTNTARLTNNGLRLQLILISKRTKITKPIFPHSFRHSRCTFTAKAGLNEMVMRQMFGWSRTSEMPSIYVSLAATDAKAAALELAGVRQPAEKEAPLKAKTCIRCGTIAPVDAIICQQCFFPLNAEAAQQQENELQGTIKAMILAALDEREKKAKT
jgi:integrase/ribosomal protein L40E